MTTNQYVLLQQDVEEGGKETSIEDDFAYRNNVLNATVEVRLGFLRKVYCLLSVQLAATVIIGATFMMVEPIRVFIHKNDWMVMVAFIVSMVTLIALFFKRRDSPANFILLAVFTVVQAYTVGVIVSFYNQAVVVQALFLTLAVVFGITIFTFNTKRDFSSMHSFLFAGLCILIVGGLVGALIQNSAVELLISIGGALLFSLFIIYDTQMMMKHISPEEYILATINLYMDIINLFIYILRILQELQRN